MLMVKTNDYFDADLEGLPTLELRQAAAWLIRMLELREFLRPKALGKAPKTGDLTGCWALKFDDPAIGHNRYRLVYRYIPNDWFPEFIDLIAVGPRFEDWVYKAAANRLNS
jgi:hypothetical protein